MELIDSNARLIASLSRLIGEYSEIFFAVAWASSGNAVYDLLKTKTACINRAVIGTHFYQTHPDILDAFADKTNVRFVLQPAGVFHPKLYLFRRNNDWEALIGSANLTSAAFSDNSEAMLLIGGSSAGASELPGRIQNLIDRYWESASTINASDAVAYREVWNQQQPALRRLAGQYGSRMPSKPSTASRVMSMGWDAYFDAVKADPYHGFKERCELLASVKRKFDEFPVFRSMALADRKTIAGLPNELEIRWPWFGSMRGAGRYHHAVNENNVHLSQALESIPLRGIVGRADYEDYINEFTGAFPDGGHGVATATRLLAMKRPDQFVCIDAKNRERLCEDFGIPSMGMDYARYWDEIIGRVLDAPWWNSKRPPGDTERSVWDGRAAMLDAIFYEE